MRFKLTRGVVSVGSRIAYGVVGRVFVPTDYPSSSRGVNRASIERIAGVAITRWGGRATGRANES